MVTGKASKTTVVACPECDEDIILRGSIQWGQQVTCPHCGTELEVINTDPVELDWVYEEYEYENVEDEEW
jgi:lysine biosynthesis protein LysW